MRTVFVLAGLGAGGAEKVVHLLAHHRRSLGDQVDVIAVNALDTRSYFPYANTINVHAVGPKGGPSYLSALARLARLRKQLKRTRPQLIVSFLTKVNALVGLATVGLNTPTIMSERNNFEFQKRDPLWGVLGGLGAKRAAVLVMQTDTARRSLPIGLKERAVVIPNPVAPVLVGAKPHDAEPRCVAVGRLERQKGFDVLLDAFAQASLKLPSASLVIYGEGPERAALENQARQLGIAAKVSLPGLTKSPQEWLEGGGIFVLSSRFEGFPNVLLEALAAGMAVVAFDCPWGPAEILRGIEQDYPLVPRNDVGALADALLRVASMPETRRRLEELGPVVAARYSEPAILAEWDAVIERAVAARGAGRMEDAEGWAPSAPFDLR